MAYACGARRSEMRHLQVAEVQLNMGILIIKEGKNSKRREIPMTDNVIADLKDYLINERHTYLKGEDSLRTEALLVNNKGKEMKGDHMNERLKELILKTGNPVMIGKEITLHCLRHAISTHLLDNGADMNFVKDFLGHAEIDTVQVYTRRRKVQQQRLKQMMR